MASACVLEWKIQLVYISFYSGILETLKSSIIMIVGSYIFHSTPSIEEVQEKAPQDIISLNTPLQTDCLLFRDIIN